MSSLTIEQIADLAGVSRSTVSRVLNDQPRVSAIVRARVLRIIEESGYSPVAAARSLASRRTSVIGLLIPRSAGHILGDPYFNALIQGLIETSAKLGYFLTMTMVTAEQEQSYYNRILRGRHFDGVVMVSSHIDDPILPLLVKDGPPLVLISRHPYLENLSWVDVENRQGAHAAVQHLIGLGHRRIATITGGVDMIHALDRRDGYKQALSEAGIALNPAFIIEGGVEIESGYCEMQQLLRLSPRPTAVFVASDTMTINALRAVHEAGLVIPDDLAIVSFDDLPLAALATPPLTTIRQPIYELGSSAAKLLIDQLEGRETQTQHVALPTQLVIRQSCGALNGAAQPIVASPAASALMLDSRNPLGGVAGGGV